MMYQKIAFLCKIYYFFSANRTFLKVAAGHILFRKENIESSNHLQRISFSKLTVLFRLSSQENKHSLWNMWEQDFDRKTASEGSYSTRQIEQTGSSSEDDKDVSGHAEQATFFGSPAWQWLLPHSMSTVFPESARSSSRASRLSSRVMIRMRWISSLFVSESPKRLCNCLW